MTILVFIFGVVTTLFPLCVMTHRKNTQPKNKVHFYVARDKEGDLTMWLGKPYRYRGYWVNMYNSVLIASSDNKLNQYGIDIEKYDNLKLEDEPVEVFLNMGD